MSIAAAPMIASIGSSVIGGMMSKKGGKGGGATQSQESSTAPWGPQQEHLVDIFDRAKEQSETPLTLYPGDFTADASIQSKGAEKDLLHTAKLLQQQVPGLLEAMQFGLKDVLSPDSNPYLQQYAGAATKNLTDAFNTNVLPGIRTQAGGAGGFNSTRKGIAEGVAARGLNDTIGELTSGLYNKAYGQGLNTFNNTLGQVGNVFQAAGMPAMFRDTVGQQHQMRTQQGIDELIARHNFAQMEPISRLAQYKNFVSGNYGSESRQSGTGGSRQGGGLGGILGGVMQGLAGGAGGGNSLAGGIFGGLGGGGGGSPFGASMGLFN